MHVFPIVLIFGFTWATVTALRVGGAFFLGAYRGVTRRLEPAAITSMILGRPPSRTLGSQLLRPRSSGPSGRCSGWSRTLCATRFRSFSRSRQMP